MGSGGSESSSSIVRSMISANSRFLDVVGIKGCILGRDGVFEDIEDCVAATGRDCGLVICGR